MLEVKIKKIINNFTLKAEFQASSDEIFGVLGGSGCGKSMVLKCIAGIFKPDEGYIVLNGKTLFDSRRKIDIPTRKRNVGYLFQNYALFPHLTIGENISIGIKEKNKIDVVKSYLEIFLLKGYENMYPAQLSGGQQQRVALARIFASEPQVLMLDEPFSALDNYLKWQVSLDLNKIISNYGRPILFVSHNRDEIYHFCDKIAIINNGKMEKAVEKKDLFTNPSSLAAAKLIGCKNIFKFKYLEDNIIEIDDLNLKLNIPKLPFENRCYLGIPEDKVKIVKSNKDNDKENIYTFKVVKVVEQIDGNILLLKRESKAILNIKVDNTTNFNEGDIISLKFLQENLFFLVGEQ